MTRLEKLLGKGFKLGDFAIVDVRSEEGLLK